MQIALSSIYPSMVTDVSESDSVIAKSLGIGTKTELSSMLQSQSMLSLAPKQAWANDIVTVKFRGVQPAWKKASSQAGGAGTQDRMLMCIADAVVKVTRPAKLASLKGLVDDDVSYHPRRGEFCVRMIHALGEPVLDVLKSRVKAIDRFVSYHEALEKMGDSITCKSATLRTIVCSYGDPVPAADVGAKSPQRQWTVTLDLSRDDINVRLERGNPHLRAVDLIQRLVNVEGGIKGLLTWLPSSLPFLKAIDSITEGWDDLAAKDQGRVDFCMRMIDWMSIRYTIRATDSMGNRSDKVLKLEARIRLRRGEPWWHIWRAERLASSPPDRFDGALQSILQGKGESWQGLVSSAAATPKEGIVNMLKAADDAAKGLIGQMDGDEPQIKQEAQSQPKPQQQLQPAATIHPQSKAKQGPKGGKQAQKGRPQGGTAQTAVVIE